MAELLLRADGTTLAMAKRLSALVGSQQNYDTCKFEFDGEWDGFDKTVVFYTNPKFKTLAKLDENDVCAFPKDAVKGYGVLFIGVFGEKDDTVLPTNYVSHILVKGANAKTEIPEDDVFGAIEIYDSVDDLPEAAENGTLASVLFEDEDGERYAILYIYKQGWIVASAEPSDDLVFVDSISDLPETGTLALVRTVSPLFDPYIFEVGQEFDKLYVNPNPITPWEEANLDWEGGGLGVAAGTALPIPQVIIVLNDNQWAYICCPFNGVIKIDDEEWQVNTPAGWVEVNFDPSTHTITGIPIDFSDIPEIEDVKIKAVHGDIGYFISPNPYPQHNETAILYAYDNGWRSVENIENLYKLVIGNTNARHTHPNADILNSFYMVDGQIYLGGIALGIKIEEVDSVSELEELPAGTRQAIVKTASEEADGDLFVEGEIYDTVYVSEKAERPLMDASVQIGSALFRARAFNPSTWYVPVGWEIHDFRDGWDYWHLPDGYDDVESTYFPITEPIPQGWYKQEWAGQEVIPISYSDLPDFSEMGKCSLMTNPRELSKFISPTPFQPAFYYTLYTRNSEGEFVPVSDPKIKSLISGLADINERIDDKLGKATPISYTDFSELSEKEEKLYEVDFSGRWLDFTEYWQALAWAHDILKPGGTAWMYRDDEYQIVTLYCRFKNLYSAVYAMLVSNIYPDLPEDISMHLLFLDDLRNFLNGAIGGLELREADYTEVNDIWDSKPDLDNYSTDSVTALEEYYYNNIAWDLKVDEQSTVDGYADALRDLIDALIPKE